MMTETTVATETATDGGYPVGTVIKLRAPLDRNGNPRRVYVRLVKGAVVGAWDEGFEGEQAIPAGYLDEYAGVVIDVSPKEYRHWLKPPYNFRRSH